MKNKMMKVTKTIKCLFFITLCIFLVSTSFVLAGQSHEIDAYVTDWKDTNYLIKNVRSDFQPNDPFSFYAYYGASTLTIPFSSIKRIIITDRIFLSHSEDFSESKNYCSGEIILKNDEFLQCSWISNGWQGYNNYDGLIRIGGNSWKEIKFGSFNDPKKEKRVKLGKRSAYPYTIHVSSFKNKHDANSLAIKLRQKGVQAFVCPTQIPDRGEYHRIFIGCYRTFKETKKAALELKGLKNLYPLEAKMPYAIQIGTFNSDQELKKLKADLQSKTYLTYIVPVTAANNKTKLLFGAFRTEKETAKYIKNLQNEGFEAKLVKR
jgi:cell division septation protein DedD